MPKDFANPLDEDIFEQINEPQQVPDVVGHSAPKLSTQRGRGMEETMFYSTHGQPDTTKRPMTGNYQYVNLILPQGTAERLRQLVRVNKMKQAPFMRWAVDRMALLYDGGIRPLPDHRDEPGETSRVYALLAPVMVDVLEGWARANRMTFQVFMRWLVGEFVTAYRRDDLRPEEPEAYVPDEAKLTHWASLTVEKYSGLGQGRSKS